jgi:predicted small lipoprotein YifL
MRLGLLALLLMTATFLTGCGSKGTQDQAAVAQNQERERLQAENQDLPGVTAENQEVQRLKKENQDLPKLRSQYQEAARLRKDNEQLRQQIAKISPAAASNQVAAALAALATQPTNAVAGAQDESTLNEGDEVMIEPKYLKQLLPDVDWDKLGRREPLGVRTILEKDGVQITNVSQLKDYGLTNYTIRRAPPLPQPPAPAQEVH